MANKIPVGATIARAYGFAFGNIINNLGAIWMPVVLLWIASYFFVARYNSAAVGLVSRGPQGLRQALPLILASGVLLLLLVSCQVAALTKESLGLRTGNAFLQFPFGAPMWRLLLSYLLFAVAIIAIYIAILIVSLIGAAVLGLFARYVPGRATMAVVGIVGDLGAIAVFCAIIYIVVRLSFFLAPVAVAERRITLIRGWLLTHGNFWRIFLLLLSVIVPVLLVEILYIYALYGWNFLPPAGMQANPEALAQWQQHQREIVLASTARMQHYWYLVYPAWLLFALLVYGLFAGSSAFAYRSLVPAAGEEMTPA
jgi:hypothetical protein